MNYKISRYGWLPDLPDHRDHYYAAPVEVAGVLPAKTDLRPNVRRFTTRASWAVAPPTPSPGRLNLTG